MSRFGVFNPSCCRRKGRDIIKSPVPALLAKSQPACARKKEALWIATTTCSKSFPTAHPYGSARSPATKTQFSNCANWPSTPTTNSASCTSRRTRSSRSSTLLISATVPTRALKPRRQKAPEILRRPARILAFSSSAGVRIWTLPSERRPFPARQSMVSDLQCWSFYWHAWCG